MAKNLPSSGAFGVAGEVDQPKTRLASRNAVSAQSSEPKPVAQFNCRLDKSLIEPLAIARIKEGKTSGEIIEPLLRGWLKKRGYLD